MSKNAKKRLFILVILSCLFLSGCGDPLTEMTPEEHDLIVAYSASVLAKYNIYQKDGARVVGYNEIQEVLAPPVTEDTIEETEEPETENSEENLAEESLSGGSEGETTQIPDEPVIPEGNAIPLAEALGLPGQISLAYNGFTVADSYMDSATAVEPSSGKVFVIAAFTMQAAEATDVNIFSKDATFYLSTGGREIANKKVFLSVTDLSTFAARLGDGEAAEAVILFEMDSETANALSDLIISAKVGDQTSRIKL